MRKANDLRSHRRYDSRCLVAALAGVTLVACGGTGGTGTSTGCSSDSDCAANEYCDVTGSSAAPLIDPECVFDCQMGCAPGDMSCGLACFESCGDGTETCGDICDVVCSPGPGVPPDAICVQGCVPDCEAHRGPQPMPDAGTQPPPTDPGTSDHGVCRVRPTPPGTDAGAPVGHDAGTMPPPPAPIDWTGTWNLHVHYTSVCQWSSLGAERRTDQDYTVTARLSGSNSDLTAVVAGDTGYTMTGTGNDTRLTLSGQFPGRDDNGNSASRVMRENNVTISIDEVTDANGARGGISGSYETSAGVSCDIASGGTIEMTR